MPQIPTKTPETIQAQVADFASERLEDRAQREMVIGAIGRGAIALNQSIAPDLYGDYRQHLSEVRQTDMETVKTRTEILEAYRHFEPIIETTEESVPIGSGRHSMVRIIEDDGKSYAVRVPKDAGDGSVRVEAHLSGAVRAKGVPHLEQIVAASYEDGVTVAELMPGKRAGDVTAAEADQITTQQLTDLVDTLIAIEQRDIAVDLHSDNILYDKNAGFGIVDLESAKFSKFRNNLGQKVGQVADVLFRLGANLGDVISTSNVNTLNDKANLLEQFKIIAQAKLQGDDLRAATDVIDALLSGIASRISSPLQQQEKQLDLV